MPQGVTHSRRTDNTLVKALACVLRSKRALDSGEFATIAEPAEREAIAPFYLARVLRLSLLSPDIVEKIPDREQEQEQELTLGAEPISPEGEIRSDRLGPVG